MAWEQVVEGLQYARNAGANLTGKLHYIVAIDTDGDVILATAASDKIIGVIREENTADNPVTIQFGGVAKVIAGGTVNPGDLITADGSGKGVVTTSAGNRVIGIALEAADASDIFPVALIPGAV